MIKLTRPPRWIDRIYPSFTWRFSVSEPVVYLTFDDGPDPEITPFVLDLLNAYNWKATFFCVGENIKKHPELFQRILNEGHRIGNHTMKHERGKVTETNTYLHSVQAFDQLHQTPLFRPPYGSLTSQQRKQITRTHRIILWSWLTYDFDLNLSNERILNRLSAMQPGDIIVLHDNAKFRERNMELFPKLFEAIRSKGFESRQID